MEELNLALGELRLRIALVGHLVEPPGGAYLDWLNCEVHATTSSFSGGFLWSVMPRGLRDLANDLQALYDAYPERGSVVFEPTESNIVSTLQINPTGGVEGTFVLRADLMDGDKLEGRFATEQAVLPRLAASVRRFSEVDAEPA